MAPSHVLDYIVVRAMCIIKTILRNFGICSCPCCRRCKQEVEMLNEEEYIRVYEIYGECIKRTKAYRETNETTFSETPVDELFRPVVEEYEKITGFKGFHHNAIMHHRISTYGQPCKNCGIPLRTPRAKMCAACGAKVYCTFKSL
ncbi:UNVERIFIED_CONTAM: hypothetical protein Cloal_2377 [Acetivibrio alkalicellulosi]